MEDQILSSSLALLFGAAHAIEPGHGKTALFTYLASGKCTWKDGVTIALSSSVTHSAVVLFVAFLSHRIFSHVDDIDVKIIFWLKIISALIIIGIGIFIFLKKEISSCSHCESHNHLHDHSKIIEEKNKGNSIIASGLIGFATGLIPCPSVIVAYLAGISSGNMEVGFKTVIMFAIGMAFSLIAVVLAFSLGGKKFGSFFKDRSSSFNWNKIQGGVFILIGAFTLLYH